MKEALEMEVNVLQVHQVKGYQPDASGLKECLTGAEIVLIPAGVPRKPGMTRDGWYNHFESTEERRVNNQTQIFSTPMPPSFATLPRPPQTPAQMPPCLSSPTQ